MTLSSNQDNGNAQLEFRRDNFNYHDHNYDMEQSIIDLIANEKNAFFIHQHITEKDLSLSDKRTIVKNLLDSDKSLFLSRYGEYLDDEKLNFFLSNDDSNNEDVHVQIRSLQCKIKSKRKMIRNRRYQALPDLIKEGYFSDNAMQSRNPFLFETMVRQYMNREEVEELRNSTYAENYGTANFSTYLVESQHKIEMAKEIDFQEEQMADHIDTNKKKKISLEEKNLLHKEFREIMIQNFLNGKDQDHFDYSKVDNNEDYDLSEEFERDQEDKYFDSD